MLVLLVNRKPGEFVRLIVPPSTEPQIVSVAVTHSSASGAKLGFTAAREVEIVRSTAVRQERSAEERPTVPETTTAI